MRRVAGVLAGLVTAGLVGCNSNDNRGLEFAQETTRAASFSRGSLPSGTGVPAASCLGRTNLDGARSYHVTIPSRVDGEAISFQVFEPIGIDCAKKHPLILEGHGYSGTRQGMAGPTGSPLDAALGPIALDPAIRAGKGPTNTPLDAVPSAVLGQLLPHAPTMGEEPTVQEANAGSGHSSPTAIVAGGGGTINALTSAGYAVISIDQRGHGQSGGKVRVMDPDFEGEDLVAIVDWAEQHLDYLAYRDQNLLLGSFGGSYGGMYQYLLYGKDPDHRLDAMVPEIAPHDLTYSLNPNGVVKSQWALILAGLGDPRTGFSQDPFIRDTLLNGAVTNEFPAAALAFFGYHSMSYFCDNPRGLKVGDAGDTSAYLLDPLTGQFPLTAGGQYLVKTPSLQTLPKVDAMLFQGTRDDLFNFNEAYRNFQCLQRGGGDVRLLTYNSGHHFLTPNLGLIEEGLSTQSLPLDSNCGPVNLGAATLAWFNEKLLGKGKADQVVTTGKNVCFALSVGDAVQVPEVTTGGQEFPVALPGDAPVPVVIGNPVPVIVPLTTAGDDGEVIAGIPTATLTIGRNQDDLNGLCQEAGSTDPVLHIATCDSTVFLGLGVIKTSSALPLVPELIDEQVIPVRGFGTHEIELVGVAERIAAGDQIVLLVYGLNDASFATTSRDITTALVTVTGTVRVPLLGNLPNLVVEVPAEGGAEGGGLCAPDQIPGIGGQCAPVP